MAILEENVAENTFNGMGILQPMLMHRWKLRQGVGTAAEANLISMNVVSFYFDFIKREYYMVLQQPAPHAGIFMAAVQGMCDSHGFQLKIEALDGNEVVIDNIVDDFVHVSEHKSGVDYASSGIMEHKLTLKTGHRPAKKWSRHED